METRIPKIRNAVVYCGIIILLLFARTATAQQHPAGVSAEEVAKSNNPLANINGLSLQDYYSSPLYDLPNETANAFLLRGIMVAGKQLIRATLP
jgi:hypothetical protein